MSTKLQVIVPVYPDPLLCQLYFRNYAKYKHKYVDRLIIVLKPHPIHGRVIKNDQGETIGGVTYNYDDYLTHIKEMEQLLQQLKITNYVIKYTGNGAEHGAMFDVAITEIYDEAYHTFFDEQDAFWLNDDLNCFIEQLDSFDLIGGIKYRLDYLETPEQLQKFNKRFGVNHTNQLFTLHLPEFLSNRIIKQIENFSGKSYNIVDPSIYCDAADITYAKTIQLDTFQALNLDVYKKTNRVKLISPQSWDIVHDFSSKVTPINFEEYVQYHLWESSSIAWMTMYQRCEDQDLSQNFVEVCRSKYTENTHIKYKFMCQALDIIPNFKYANQYKQNIERGCALDGELLDPRLANKPLVDLTKYDCKQLVKQIL